jgi:hypothetical protein
MSLAQRYAGSPGFEQLSLRSADVNAVNNALHAGSKPENLVMGPAAFFMQPATPEGIVKAQTLLSQRAASATKVGGAGGSAARESAPTRKPWWRFW